MISASSSANARAASRSHGPGGGGPAVVLLAGSPTAAAWDRGDLDAALAFADEDAEIFSRVVGVEGSYAVTRESVAGGRTCTTRSPTGTPRSARSGRWATRRLPGCIFEATAVKVALPLTRRCGTWPTGETVRWSG